MLFILSILLQLFTIWAIFFYGLSRVTGAITMIGAVIITALISPWSLILGIPLILLSLVLLVDSLRMNLITRPAFDRLSNAMPSISTTEREALEAGTSWWEKNCLWARQTGISLTVILIRIYLKKNNLSLTMKSNNFVTC